ncbi:MAG TPA: queuosine salvage family protein, partial [Phycisphaerae bacterium]|nr:queuosine salvage family protein [Phycisphaerae bacterium]
MLESTRAVVENARHVRVDDDAIKRWARSVSPLSLAPDAQAGHDLFGHIPGTREQVANFVLLLDALNFCFWSSDPIRIEWRGRTYERYSAMLVSLILSAKQDPR